MRQILIAAAMAVGLIALWAAILPLAAQTAPPLVNTASTAPAAKTMSKALFLCRGAHGVDQTCAAALAKALVLDASDHATTSVSDRICRADPRVFATTAHRD